jgi:hypothetical protein
MSLFVIGGKYVAASCDPSVLYIFVSWTEKTHSKNKSTSVV